MTATAAHWLLSALVRSLAPPSGTTGVIRGVDGVSGGTVVAADGARGAEEGLYWRLESLLKPSEAVCRATMVATGEVLHDNFHLTLDALLRRLKVSYVAQPRAVPARVGDEFERRVRVDAATWQTTLARLSLCRLQHGWTAVALVPHRVLGPLVVPLLLAALLLSQCSGWARIVLALQTAGYALAAAGSSFGHGWTAVPLQFALTNASH